MDNFSGFMVIGVYAFFVVVLWRFLRALESIAESLKNVAEHLKKEP